VAISTQGSERAIGDNRDSSADGDVANAKSVWTVQEAAAYLALPVNSLYKMTGPKARLRVPHIRIAGRLRFRRADLDRWLDLLSVSNLEVLAKARRGMPRR